MKNLEEYVDNFIDELPNFGIDKILISIIIDSDDLESVGFKVISNFTQIELFNFIKSLLFKNPKINYKLKEYYLAENIMCNFFSNIQKGENNENFLNDFIVDDEIEEFCRSVEFK